MLTIDVGSYHTVACIKEADKYNVYLFQSRSTVFEQRLKEIAENLSNIKENIKQVVIEQQMPNTINIQIQYSIGMYFHQKGISVKLQKASVKYKNFKGDRINNKVKSAIFVQGMLQEVNIVFNGWQKTAYKNHVYLTEEAKAFMQKHSIEKLDDIGDVVLMQMVEVPIAEGPMAEGSL